MKRVTLNDIKKRGKRREMRDIEEDIDFEDIKRSGKERNESFVEDSEIEDIKKRERRER